MNELEKNCDNCLYSENLSCDRCYGMLDGWEPKESEAHKVFERLTKKGFTLKKWQYDCNFYQHVLGFSYPQLYDLLAEYEDTGLTPNEIEEINKIWNEDIFTCREVRAELDLYRKAKVEGRLVEVVRCGECKYRDSKDGYCEVVHTCCFGDDDFCSYGKRREETKEVHNEGN